MKDIEITKEYKQTLLQINQSLTIIAVWMVKTKKKVEETITSIDQWEKESKEPEEYFEHGKL